MLGELIKTAREKLEMNQKELAEKTGITQATISRIESGQVKDPRLDALKRIAKALNLPIDYFFEPSIPDKIKISFLSPVDFLTEAYICLSHNKQNQLIDFALFLINKPKHDTGYIPKLADIP